MARKENGLPDPYDNGFHENYGSAMRERIRGWRDRGLSFYSISKHELPPEYDVSGRTIQKRTNIYDLEILEGADGIREGMMFMNIRGCSLYEMWDKLFEEGVYVDLTSIPFALDEWNGGDGKGDESMETPKSRKNGRDATTLYRSDPVTDFPLNGGSVSTGRISYRPRF